jgi:hypothetical protein
MSLPILVLNVGSALRKAPMVAAVERLGMRAPLPRRVLS